MSLQIFNTLTRKKEDFTPVNNNKVNMYVCGVTVYDRCHLGHARNIVVFDVIVRYLMKKGYDVNFIRNFTDIDDKIIKRANEEGIDTVALAKREIENFYADTNPLGVLNPNLEPKATEHIPEMINLIQSLIEKGVAYISDGDVYFSVRKFQDYGELSGRNLDELQAGARIAVAEKKDDPMDFALWKVSKEGEPGWENPFGAKGRPGWHIECSAMSMKYLGETIDIHGGGLDLIFPHHENEKAQSEACTHKPFVKYWVHNGFVTINGEKMSKSLGNFYTIKDILKDFEPEALRLFLLSKHYRSPLDFSFDFLKENDMALNRGYQALYDSQNIVSKPVSKDRPMPDDLKDAVIALTGLPERFFAAMDDDFNTALGIGYIFEAIRALNRLIQAAEKKPSKSLTANLEAGIKNIMDTASVLGIFVQNPGDFIRKRNLKVIEKIGITEDEILKFIERRNLARTEKNWAEADNIREELFKKGIKLMDGLSGTTWTVAIE